MTEVPVKHFVALNKRVTTFYKHRACNTVVVGINWVIRAAVKFIYNFLDPFQVEKVIIFGNDFADFFEERIGVENLEEKFGGTLPNVEANFFPPHYNHDELRGGF